MKQIRYALQGWVLGLLVLGGTLGFVPLALAQGIDQEPNNACPMAQDFGAVALPFLIEGSLDSAFESPDVDFFRFTGTPGAILRVDLEGQATGKGTLEDPLLGLFDSGCNLLVLNDDNGETLNSRLAFTVPADGVFILAATAYPDSEFLGGGIGTYQLTIAQFPVNAVISGHIVDAVTGEPLPGDAFPFTNVLLLRCEELGCFDVSFQRADSAGRFRFSFDFSVNPLEAGTYQVLAFADEYEQGQTDLFDVGEGEDRDIGDLPLQPFPIRFSEIRPCGNLPPEGGTCRYSVRVTNRSATPLQGAAWSLVGSNGIGSVIDFTQFQTAKPQKMILDSGESKIIRFEFAVPGTVRDNIFICTQAFFGQDHLNPFFDTVGQRNLFCISKGSLGAFSVVADREAQKLHWQLNRQSRAPLKEKEKVMVRRSK